jgi:DNA polymerase-1
MKPVNSSTSSYNTLYLVDISSFIFRAFYAIREMTTPDGVPVNAVYGVATMLGRLLDEAKPDYLAIVYDSNTDEPSFRKVMYDEYKANRSDTPPTLIPQFELIEELITNMGIPSYRQSGVEADDLIATLTRRWIKEDARHRVVVVTGDKDLMALVTPKVQVWDTMKDQHFTPHEVEEKFGVKPSQICDYLSMVGDSSDNIPGITGIGPKGAELLLKEFVTLEGVIAAAKAGKVKGKKGQMIVEGEEIAHLSKRLVSLKDDLVLEVSADSAKFDFVVKHELLEFFKKHNLKSLYTKYAGKAQMADGAPMAEDDGSMTVRSMPANPLNEAKDQPIEQNAFNFTAEQNLIEATQPYDMKNKPVFEGIHTIEALKSLIGEIEKTKLMAFDTETTSLDPKEARLVGIAIGVSEAGAYYIPVGHAMTLESVGDQLELDEVLRLLKPVLENKEIKKVGQNLKYDVRVILNQGIRVEGIFADTMVAAYALDSSGRHNLDFLSKRYLGYETTPYEQLVGKGVSQVTFDQVSIQAATQYAAEDAWCAFMLWKVLEPKLKEQNVEKLYHQVDLPLVQVVADMEEAGIKVDVPFLQKIEKQFETELKEVETKIRSFSQNPNLNVNSPKQLAGFLFEELKLPPQGKTKTGFSTDASVLEKLASIPGASSEVPRIILEFREIAKLKGTYVLPLQELRSKKDQRIRTHFNLTGTATGRLSSSDPNLQNIPTRSKRGQLIREAFIADEGSVLMSADYSQIELRILAHLSGDENLVKSFAVNEDVHRRTASEIYHVKPEAVTDEQRGVAKAINFGLMYGKSVFGLAEELGISRTEAKDMITRYFNRYSRVKEFLDEQIASAHANGYVMTLLGRKRALPEIKASNHAVRANAERMAMNSPIQGTASDLIKVAMVELHEKLKGKKTKLLLQVHDELVLECPLDEVEEVKKLVTETMEGALKLSVPLKVNVSIGRNWAEL